MAFTGYREDDFRAFLYKTSDGGETWASIADGIPAEAVNVVREDPVVPGVLYVGTELGAYVSLDGGGTWATLGSGLPTVPVYDLVVHPREGDVVLGTHGRGFWILDVRLLRQLAGEGMAEGARPVRRGRRDAPAAPQPVRLERPGQLRRHEPRGAGPRRLLAAGRPGQGRREAVGRGRGRQEAARPGAAPRGRAARGHLGPARARPSAPKVDRAPSAAGVVAAGVVGRPRPAPTPWCSRSARTASARPSSCAATRCSAAAWPRRKRRSTPSPAGTADRSRSRPASRSSARVSHQ